MYIAGLHLLNCSNFILEIERIQTGGKINPKDDRKLVDVIKNKPIRLAAKVMVPVRDHPKVSNINT